MSQPDAERSRRAKEDEEIAPTPFDNPFFLPVILVGFAIWFIYDGWFNPNMEWIKFNRVRRGRHGDPRRLLHLARASRSAGAAPGDREPGSPRPSRPSC